MLKIKNFMFNLFQENTYIVWCNETNECAIIDPGCSNESENSVLKNFVEGNNLTVKYLLNTHCHIDHVLGNKFVKDLYNPDYLVPEKDKILLEHFDRQTEMIKIDIENPPIPEKFIDESTEIKIGKLIPQFLFTPGHTPGEVCIYFNTEKVCITGDVLFKRSIGRSDLWGGDYATLLNSIENELMTLEDDVIIYPGHGNSSTIGDERKYNPFLKGISKI
jgi:glyoxylase-like metal-dependent hydrolase (beta-lactamase superfamily II)